MAKLLTADLERTSSAQRAQDNPQRVALTPALTLPFSALVNSAVNPSVVDWGDIDGITSIMSGPGASGFALDTFNTRAVPEPDTVALMLAGLAWVASLSRRPAQARRPDQANRQSRRVPTGKR